MMKKLSLLILTFLVSCSGLPRKDNYTLKFIGDVAFEPQTKFQDIPFGGISGITYDSQGNQLIGISDDRSTLGPARFYNFDLKLTENVFDIKISSLTVLKAANARAFKKGEVDFEGITLSPTEKLLISSEGDNRKVPRIPPSIMIFNKDGSYHGWVPLPEKFIPEYKGKQTQGSRNNLSLESLGMTKNGKYIFTAAESTLVQDGPMATTQKEGVVRLLRLKRKNDNFIPDGEFAYPLSKIPSLSRGAKTKGINGLVELIPLSKNHIFSMERAWTPENRKQTIKIFKITINSNTTNITNLDSLINKDYIAVKKTLVANLDDFVPLLKNGKRKLDNIEGFALGPILPNGKQSLIVVSDDNFNKHQRTILIAFEII